MWPVRVLRRKVENWLHEIAASNEYPSGEETIKLIEEHIDEPWAHGPLEDAVQAIRDGIDEAALVYLAKLAAWQFRDKVYRAGHRVLGDRGFVSDIIG